MDLPGRIPLEEASYFHRKRNMISLQQGTLERNIDIILGLGGATEHHEGLPLDDALAKKFSSLEPLPVSRAAH